MLALPEIEDKYKYRLGITQSARDQKCFRFGRVLDFRHLYGLYQLIMLNTEIYS